MNATEKKVEPADIAATATDLEWHLATEHGFCGGCGLDTDHCHPGQCCTEARDLMRMLDSVCDLCPTRVATGQVRSKRVVP